MLKAKIQHISFDLWLTLIKSNPLFKLKRAEQFYREYNLCKLELPEVIRRMTEVDRGCDAENERTGLKIPATAMYALVLVALGFEKEKLDDQLLYKIKKDADLLFWEYPPCLLNHHVKDLLENLKNNRFGLNLASNTGFIESETLIPVLKELGLYHYFDFFIFSDQIHASKPAPLFFDALFERVKDRLTKEEVVHIGDNYSADFVGATEYGFHAVHLDSRDYCYSDIIKKIYEKDEKF